MKDIKQHLLYAVCQNVPDAICLIDTEWNIRAWNRGAENQLGYSADEIIGKSVAVIIPADIVQQEIEHCVNELNTKGKISDYETVRLAKDGRVVPIELTAVALEENGAITHYAAIMRDISRRKRMEEEFATISRRNELILESAAEGIFGMDSRGNHIFLNSAGRKMLGYSADELMGKHSHMIWHHTKADGSPYHENECRIYMTARDGMSRRVDDEVFWTKDGTSIPVEYTTNAIYEGTFVTGAVVTFRDIRERIHARRKLDQAYAELEEKVRGRTRELAHTNEELRMEITERRRAVEIIRGAHALSDALNRLDTVIHSTLDFEEIMKRVVEDSAQAIEAEGSAIGLIRDDLFEVRYAHNMAAPLAGWTVPLDSLSGVSLSARTGNTIAFNDAASDGRLNLQFIRKWRIRSMLVSPFIMKKRMAGAIVFYSFSSPFTFRQEHIDFARKLGASLSLALENAELYRALQASERTLHAVLSSIPDIAWMKDRKGRFILVNEAFARSSGTTPDKLTGKTDFDVWPRELAEHYRSDDDEVMKKGRPKRVEEPLASADGTKRWIETIKTPIHDQAGRVIGTVGIARDTTDRRRMEEEITHMAQHDALTELPNRRLFVDIVKLEMAQARRHGNKAAILFLDLDRFKEINDALGHDFGDMLLQQVAGRFKRTIRESDTVARIGGDEFNVVLSDIERPEDVSDIAQKIVNSLREPIVLKGHQLHTTTSVGISIYPDDSEEIETLLRYADIAMYHAKEDGRNTFRYYNASLNVRSVEKAKLENLLSAGISRGELSIHYQPQIDVNTKRLSRVEALVRWDHPQRGLLGPEEFLPLAEETGAIATIDEWVLRTVCSQARSWTDTGFDSFSVTVNFSARLFQSTDLPHLVSTVLKETGMPPRRLDIEVTENTAMSNIERTVSQLRELADLGVCISIDDFGTGYSSFSYLKKLPIGRVKIDKSFVQDIERDPDDRAIISAVASMAHKMGIRTVAVGVETEEQLEFVKAAGCDEVQGFIVARPLPAEKFRRTALRL